MSGICWNLGVIGGSGLNLTISSLYRFSLAMTVFVAPLRAYSLASVDGFNLSLFRLSLISLLLFALLQFSGTSAKLPSFSRIGITLGSAMMFLSVSLASFILSSLSRPLEGDVLTRTFVRIVGFGLVMLLVLVSSKRRDLLLAGRAFLISAVVPLSIGTYQLIYYLLVGSFPPLPLSSLTVISPSADTFNRALGLVYWKYPRLTSTFLEPNYYGMFLMSVVLISLAFLLNGRDSAKSKFLFGALVCISLVQLFFTLSLSSAIGLAVGFLVLLTLSRAKWLRLSLVFAFIGSAIVVVNYLMSLWWGVSFIQAAVERVVLRMGDISELWGRASYFLGGVSAFADSPVLGVGYVGLVEYVEGSIPSAHNAFLTVLGAHGLLGFLPLVFFFVHLILRLYRNAQQFRHQGDGLLAAIGAGLLSAIVGMITANQAYDAMFSFDASWVLLAVAAAYAALPSGGGPPRQ